MGPVDVSPRKTSSNGNTRFRTDEIYETLIELVEVSGSDHLRADELSAKVLLKEDTAGG